MHAFKHKAEDIDKYRIIWEVLEKQKTVENEKMLMLCKKKDGKRSLILRGVIECTSCRL